MSPRYAFGDGPDGVHRIYIGETALPCPGVALRLRTVIDCTPAEARMPAVTIDFLKNLPAPQQRGAAATRVVSGRFMCDTGDFVLISQIRRVEAMVAAAGLPRECTPSVNGFLHLSLASAANSFYKAVAVRSPWRPADPESIAAAGDEPERDGEEGEDESVPPGADAGECAICYGEYLVGGAAAVRLLACGHAFHRGCIDRWTAVKRTCPC